MVFGMLPLALALSESGELQASMGRAIIGGVITSTLLTLVVVPVMYWYTVLIPQTFKQRFGKRGATGAGGAQVFMPADKE
jgi:AcrB/AcrD/AcrF family